MSDLTKIAGLDDKARGFLEITGYNHIEALARTSPEILLEEFRAANEALELGETIPSPSQVERWISQAQALVEEEAANISLEEGPKHVPANPLEHNSRKSLALQRVPTAIPLPVKIFSAGNLAVESISPAILFDESMLEKEDEDSPLLSSRVSVLPLNTQTYQWTPPEKEVRIAKEKTAEAGGESIEPIPFSTGENIPKQKLSLRSAKGMEQKKFSRRSRRFVRGVLHTNPYGITFAALWTLITIGTFPISVGFGLFFLLSKMKPLLFWWVPEWFLYMTLLLPVAGIIYLVFALSGRCKICSQRLFYTKSCERNIKAPHIAGLGYIIPLCLHILLFRWFRCTYCGTPVRLKE